MAKQRYINTKFWSDNWIIELDPLERYLFLYFLTNEHTNIAGVYELPLRTMAFETGIDKEMLEKMLPRFAGRVYYLDGWVYIKNFAKHQKSNDSVEKGIKREMKGIPEEILAKIEEIGTDKGQTGDSLGTEGVQTATYLDSYLDLDLTDAAKAADEVNPLITLFQEINPSFAILFKRKPQREAAKRLLKLHGLERLKKVIGYIKAHSGERYLPTITTPCQLEDKWAALEGYAKKSVIGTGRGLA